MGKWRVRCLVAYALVGTSMFSSARSQPPASVPISVDASMLLDAAGPEQRKSLGAIYLIVCPNEGGNGFGAGSGFLLDTGVLVTNSHVVGDCTEKNLFAIGTDNQRLTFSHIINDTERDLALLIPASKLSGGLKLADIDGPEPGTLVSTWGYPFVYNGASPLLSVGYVAGYRNFQKAPNSKSVKHIIVNGAFNHGNSGGPLLIARDNAVIGVVVLTFSFYPPQLQAIINGLLNQKNGFQIGTVTNPDGTRTQVSEAQVTGAVLQEFYNKTQVVIGEAIASSELGAVLKEHASELK